MCRKIAYLSAAIVVLASVLIASVTPAHAQQAGKVYRIGYLHPGNPGTSGTKVFREELRNLGYEEGRNITIDFRSAKSRKKLLPGMATELVR